MMTDCGQCGPIESIGGNIVIADSNARSHNTRSPVDSYIPPFPPQFRQVGLVLGDLPPSPHTDFDWTVTLLTRCSYLLDFPRVCRNPDQGRLT